MEMPEYGKLGKPKSRLSTLPTLLGNPWGFPHYHGYGDDYHLSEDRQSPPKTRNQSHSHRKELVNHLPGLKRKGSPGTFMLSLKLSHGAPMTCITSRRDGSLGLSPRETRPSD
jgi:hypothetical protein